MLFFWYNQFLLSSICYGIAVMFLCVCLVFYSVFYRQTCCGTAPILLYSAVFIVFAVDGSGIAVGLL